MTEAELKEIEAKVCGIFYSGPTMKEVRELLALARFAIKEKEALELAAPFLCSTLCPSTKKDHEEWTHCKSCASVNEALASYPEVKP